MPKNLLALTLFFLISFLGKGQSSAPIRGLVTDSLTGAPLEDATVSLEGFANHVPVQRIRSNRNGFVLRRPAPGNYRLITTYLGYAPDTVALVFNSSDTLLRLLRIRMRPSPKPLMEVVVHAIIPPAIVRNDTIAFNAGAYPTRPNASVEDLLKRLPGIEIDKNGNITMQGRKVDKIYLDGKEFFLKDLKTATQSLPADLVGQIEAFDSQSDRARLTGVREESNTKTLNIKLKKDRKKGYFGKLYAGAGDHNSYSAGGTATNLSPSRWLLANVDVNNINNQFTGTEHSNGPGAGGVQSFTNIGFNYRDNWGSRLTATLNAGENSSRTNLISGTNRQTFLADSSLSEDRFSRSDSRSTNFYTFSTFEFRIDSLTSLLLRNGWTRQSGENSSQDSVNIHTQKPAYTYLSSNGATINSSSPTGSDLNNSLDFRHRFLKKGRGFYLRLTELTMRQDQPASLYSRIDAFDSVSSLVQHTLIDQRSAQHTSGNVYGGSAQYTEPLGPNHILDLGYQVNTIGSRSDKESFDYDSSTGRYDRPDTLTTNRFFSRNTVQRLNIGYNTTEGKIRYQLGVATQFTDLRNDNYSLNSHLSQHFTNWYPRANLNWQVAKGENLNLGYTGTSRPPTIDQLQPLPDLSNPFLVRLGNPGLQQQFDHNLNMSYSSFNSRNSQNFQAAVNGSFTEHQITTATTLLPGGVQQIQYINVDGNYHFNSNLTYGFPLGNKKGNGNASLHGQYGQESSIINGAANKTTATGWGGRLNLNYHPREKLFVDLTASLDRTNSDYSLNTQQSTQSSLQNYSLDVSYEFPLSITLTSNYVLQVTGSQAGLPTRRISLWNASLYKSLFPNHAGQLRLSAFDLLGTGSNYSQSVGTNYIETRQSNLPGRLLLFSFIYNFRWFPVSRRE